MPRFLHPVRRRTNCPSDSTFRSILGSFRWAQIRGVDHSQTLASPPAAFNKIDSEAVAATLCPSTSDIGYGATVKTSPFIHRKGTGTRHDSPYRLPHTPHFPSCCSRHRCKGTALWSLSEPELKLHQGGVFTGSALALVLYLGRSGQMHPSIQEFGATIPELLRAGSTLAA